jgi:hypothetical protein
VTYSTLWSQTFADAFFTNGLREWLETGRVTHDQSHVRDLAHLKLPADDEKLGRDFGRRFRSQKAILGVFDEGCMGMFNAIIPDDTSCMQPAASKSASASPRSTPPCVNSGSMSHCAAM